MMSSCPHCGWPDAQPFQVLSRHRTSRGLTVWARCSCGSLQMREVDERGVRVSTRGRPDPRYLQEQTEPQPEREPGSQPQPASEPWQSQRSGTPCRGTA